MRAIKNAPYTHLFSLETATTLDLVDAPASFANYYILGDDAASQITPASAPARVGTTTGYCELDLTATEFIYDLAGIRVEAGSTNSKIDWIRTEPCIDSGVAQAGTAQTITLRSGVTLSDDQVVGNVIELVRGTGAGQSRVCVKNVGSSDIVTVDRPWSTNPSSDTVYIIHPYMGAVTNGGIIASSVSDSTPTATEFDGATGLSATNDFYNNCTIVFTSGTLQGIMCRVTDYVGATRTFTISTQPSPLPSAPADGDYFLIVGRVF